MSRREDRPKTAEGKQPKILAEDRPKEGEESEDVKKHNEELAKSGHHPKQQNKNEETDKDKVGKQFWSGESNCDSSQEQIRSNC